MNSPRIFGRPIFRSAIIVIYLLTIPFSVIASESEPALNDDGLHSQDWFLESFLDLAEDLETAAENGKKLVVLFEQRGCPYCRELHRVNFANKEIREIARNNFEILQLNLWGSRKVTDFDGQEIEERKLAQKWRVNFTPTFIFFPSDIKLVKGKPGSEGEVVRMPGYMKPFHFSSMLEFVQSDQYREQNFQRYLQDKFKRLEAEGKKPDVW